VSEDGGRPGPDLERREVDGRVEAMAVIEVEAPWDPHAPGDAARTAARVALLCALEMEPANERLAEVEVLGGRGEPPELEVHGLVAERLAGRVAHISLTHEGSVAAALVVLPSSTA
jgi:phosphopantetheinyl transferase (holo-ACP synthase)